ncbi:two-component system sensor histidine kinase YesM [Paenibacillus taihuensis]|uniref:histidine kinase n=1 Tax=Paenibacillus taihuensis TaxID=1156355 RepID=A0A3D9SHL8_9BACL|nr:histidine kinase [Paenibacillus taihuensis]REE92770.1 two-component system sensor histidine kinase YesM [Paenibacillus taihuensis]
MRTVYTWLNSLRVKLFATILLFMVPLIVIITINDYYSAQVVRNQVAQSNKNLLNLYMNQIDSSMSDVDNYLFNLSERNTDLLQLEAPKEVNDSIYSLAKIRLYNELSSEIEYYKSADVFFIYSTVNDDLLTVGRNNYGATFEDRSAIQVDIGQFLKSDLSGVNFERWHVWESKNGYYLYHLIKTGTVYLGAWVRVDRLMIPFNFMNFGKDGFALLATNKLAPMQLEEKVASEGIDLRYTDSTFVRSGTSKPFLVMGEPSAQGDFNLIAVLPESEVLEKLPYLQRISSVITTLACIFLLLFMFIMRRVFLQPIGRIISAMRKLKDGNWQSSLKPYSTSSEFQILNETFNGMITEIRDLKINVYEEKLNHQRAELMHLQLQINPHFFLNTLNIIYNLATVKDFAVIQEMTKNLVAYFRFMFRSNSYVVTLQEELAHTRSYLRIQQLRFPDHLTYNVEAEEELLGLSIPPLVIQTIVENSIKHAFNMEEVMEIHVRVTADRASSPMQLHILIMDSGPGYPEDVLQKLQNNEEMISDAGENIGIWNIKRRLKLLYPGKSQISFWNEPGQGAAVRIQIPIDEKEL